METETMKNIDQHWSHIPNRLPRTRWWQSRSIMRHVGKKVTPLADGTYWGASALSGTGRSFARALSIGCGEAQKEIAILKSGIVGHVDLFELAKERIAVAENAANKAGVRERCSFHYGDFFTSSQNQPGCYDLVFWSSSLHHMLDTRMSVRVSYQLLKEDGWIYIDEYTDKNRFQFSDIVMILINGVRLLLPDKVFIKPDTKSRWSRIFKRPRLQTMIDTDPSEAADSENIIPSMKEYFPHGNIIPLGGVVYSLALENILTNIQEDSPLMEQLLDLDDKAIKHGHSLHSFMLAPKKLGVI